MRLTGGYNPSRNKERNNRNIIELELYSSGIACLFSNQNTQKVKYERFLIGTRQNNVHISFSAKIAFIKATSGQIAIQHNNDEHLAQCDVRASCSEVVSVNIGVSVQLQYSALIRLFCSEDR